MEELRSAIADIIEDDARAGDVIRHLRALLKKDEPRREPVDMNRLIRRVLTLTRDEMTSHHVVPVMELSEDAPAVMGPMDAEGRWYFGITLAPGVAEPDDDTVRRRVCQAMGRELEIEILTRDVWAAHRLIAQNYRDRRVFLAGDACHLHPPFGGYGMNLGIADGVDLGWKLGAVLAGWGGEALLASYEHERRPVHLRTIAEATENYRTLSVHLLKDNLDADGPDGDRAREVAAEAIRATKTREFKTLGVVLGSRYVDGGGVRNWGLLRRLISRGGCIYARAILHVKVHDLTGGFKCIHRRVLETIDLGTVRAEGYVFQIEVTYRALLAGFKVVEVPIVFSDRTVGTSKMSSRIAAEAMWRVPSLRRTAPAALAQARQ